MAFSFRVGTNWCHDFPKLARESGFYFNMHRNRVRVDWNRISSIDVDRVIRERDFLTVDENVHNVIDYSLENEYDVKILDPNFVKLFRLAQLSVEYLLYCKQYLDQSIIILKEELKAKIEENVKLKKEQTTNEDQIRNLKEKLKDRDRIIEMKISDSHGEIYKCPHCMKTFISAMFVQAHISRRHPNSSEVFSTSSPIHENYRAETEKLHNEIKTLKERINQTERVIRNESIKVSQNVSNGLKTSGYNNVESQSDKQESRIEEQHKRYQEEISSLKMMLFGELKNLKESGFKEIKSSGLYDSETKTLKELLRQQENEIQKLRNQLQENVTSDLETMQNRFQKQDAYWKSKLEHLENEHRADIENLFKQLKLTQESADKMKLEYETKVSNLEKQSEIQSKILTAQSEQLNSISQGIQDNHQENQFGSESSVQLKHPKGKLLSNNNVRNDAMRRIKKSNTVHDNPKREISSENIRENDLKPEEDLTSVTSESSRIIIKESSHGNENLYSEFSKNKISKTESQMKSKISPESGFFTAQDSHSISKSVTNGKNQIKKSLYEDYSEDTSDVLESSNECKKSNQDIKNLERNRFKTREESIKVDVHDNQRMRQKSHSEKVEKKRIESSIKSSESEVDEYSSETANESQNSVSHSEDSYTENSIDNSKSMKSQTLVSGKSLKQTSIEKPLVLSEIKNNLLNSFERELRELGIDPEWKGIPKVTFREKLRILKHQRKFKSKKYETYDQIRKKLLNEVSRKLSIKQKETQIYETEKKSLLNKMMSNVKSKAMKALHFQTAQDNKTMNSPSCDSTMRLSQSKQKVSLDLLPKKFEIREYQREKHNRSIKIKDHDFQNDSSPISIPKQNSIKLDRLSNRNYSSTKEMTDSTLSLKKLYHSYESIKDILGQANDNSQESKTKLDMTSVKVTSTPNKNTNNILQDSYSTVINDHEIIHSSPFSPKNNKSVLKSTTGSAGSLVKKKVLFDLKGSPEKNSMRMRSLGEILTEYDTERKEVNDSDWNISSISEEKDQTIQKEKSKSMDNIVLKTSQSEKIAQISERIEKQLSMPRSKPVGSIEAMFLAKTSTKSTSSLDHNYDNALNPASSNFENPEYIFNSKQSEGDQVSQAAPRTIKSKEVNLSPTNKELITKDSDSDLDIDELLEIV